VVSLSCLRGKTIFKAQVFIIFWEGVYHKKGWYKQFPYRSPSGTIIKGCCPNLGPDTRVRFHGDFSTGPRALSVFK